MSLQLESENYINLRRKLDHFFIKKKENILKMSLKWTTTDEHEKIMWCMKGREFPFFDFSPPSISCYECVYAYECVFERRCACACLREGVHVCVCVCVRNKLGGTKEVDNIKFRGKKSDLCENILIRPPFKERRNYS